MVALFLIAVFTIVYEIRMWNNAESSGERRSIPADLNLDGRHDRLSGAGEAQSLLAACSIPRRRSLRDRYTAEADRVIADYREASESTPVYRARTGGAPARRSRSAMSISPEDKSIRGKYQPDRRLSRS